MSLHQGPQVPKVDILLHNTQVMCRNNDLFCGGIVWVYLSVGVFECGCI